MRRRTQQTVATSLAILSAVALAGVGYLTFAFPKTLAQWEEQGRALSGVELLLANLSGFWAQFGIPLAAALFLAFVGCGVWSVVARCAGQNSP